jgi:hypothetical protein
MGMGLGLGLRLGNVAASGGGQAGTPYPIPNYFTTTSLFPYAVIDNGNGTFSSTFAAANFKDAGGPFYISPSGDDTTGTGAIGAPWKTISKALTTAASGSLINMAAGRYAPPAPTDGAGKLMSFVAATLNTVFVGNLLANADVSSWGTLASGRQTVTLTTGVVAGFVDTTKTDATTSVFQTSFNAIAETNIPGFQTSSQGAIYRPSLAGGSTPSVLGSFDNRDLTNTFDTTLMAWRAGAPTTYFAGTAGGKLYFENLVFVGELLMQPADTTSQIVINNCNHIGGDNLIESGTSDVAKIAIRNMIAVAQKGAGASDIIDLNCIALLENVRAYNAALGGADQSFTAHNGPAMFINCYFVEGSSGPTGTGGRQGYFGCTVNGVGSALNVGAASTTGKNIDTHVKKITWGSPPPVTDILMQPFSKNTALYDYDGSTTGKTIGNGGVVTSRANRPGAIQTMLYVDPSQIGTLFQDAGRTTPVTADGQNVMGINCGAGTGGYATVTSAAGSVVYHTDGTYSWLTTVAARMVLNSAIGFAEDTTIIFGINSTDSSFNLLGYDTSTFLDFRSTGNPYGNCGWKVTANGGFAVNAGTPAFLATIKSTACNGSNNVFTARRADLLWTPWRTSTLFAAGPTGTGSFDGKIYGVRFTSLGTDAEIKAAEQAMGLKMGTVIP